MTKKKAAKKAEVVGNLGAVKFSFLDKPMFRPPPAAEPAFAVNQLLNAVEDLADAQLELAEAVNALVQRRTAS